MKKICLIIVAVVATLFMCSAAVTFMSDSKVTITYNSMSYTTSLTSAKIVYDALPKDLRDQIREAFVEIDINDWIVGTITKGNYQGVSYCYDGNTSVLTMKYDKFSIKATNINKGNLADIFDLNCD